MLNNTTQPNTSDNRLIEPDLLAFVRSGKGLVVIHTGADNFNKAEQAVELVRNGRIGKVVRIDVGLPYGGRSKPGDSDASALLGRIPRGPWTLA